MRWVEQRQVCHVVVVDDGPGHRDLVWMEVEGVLQCGQGAVRLVHNELGVHLGYEEELALAHLGRRFAGIVDV